MKVTMFLGCLWYRSHWHLLWRGNAVSLVIHVRWKGSWTHLVCKAFACFCKACSLQKVAQWGQTLPDIFIRTVMCGIKWLSQESKEMGLLQPMASIRFCVFPILWTSLILVWNKDITVATVVKGKKTHRNHSQFKIWYTTPDLIRWPKCL